MSATPIQHKLDVSKDLSTLFEEQVKRTPDAIALEDADVSLTYAELERTTRALAIELRRDYHVGRDSLVGVLMGRCADYVIASLAALRAGGAFLVLEMAYPDKLLRKVVLDARPKVILTHEKHAGRLPQDVAIKTLDQHSAPSSVTGSLAPSDNDLDRLAFVSYSSGTTGEPKGIANPHRAAVGSYSLRFGVCDLQQGDRVACNVFFIWEILRPLLRGATTVAVPDVASYDPELLVEFLDQHKITDTLMTPTLLATVLTRHQTLALPHLRSLWLNGEVVTVDLCQQAARALPNVRLFNVYSASETHEVAAGEVGKMLAAALPANGVCPVGPLLDPSNMYIVEEEGDKLVKDGGVGELCVGGPLLARDYLNLPEATAKAFLRDPFKAGGNARMYRTGDAARVVNGLLEITGRIGGMIKTRGYTVHPGAVETAIVKRLAVRSCAVVGHGEGVDKKLVAYIVKERTQTDRPWPLIEPPLGHSTEARRLLANDLAQYMIPSVWIELDSLPTHAVSGKIDSKALPSPPTTRPSTPTLVSASGARQIRKETIVESWAASLGVPKEVITDETDFFDLGGHSLALADLAAKLSKNFGFHIPLSALASDASLSGHMAAITAARDGHLAELQSDLPNIIAADCKLDDEIRYWNKDAKRCRISEADTILLTGATGYLGAFILRSLIEKSPAKIICLVRFPQPSESCKPDGLARIRSNLVDLGLWNDSLLDRIEVLPGNLPQSHLALSVPDFAQLAKRVQVIIHAAAVVNLVYPYAALRAANVGGAREILRLAALGGATLHHVSSNGALPITKTGAWTESAEVSVQEVIDGVTDGYGQTKWVAEQLVLQAKARGMHVDIIRPGTLSGCSETGVSNPYDLLNSIVVESLRIGHSPQIDGWRCEMTPVNYVAKAITALCEYDGEEQTVFHLADRDPLPVEKLFASLNTLGYTTKSLPWAEWVALWQSEREGRNKNTKVPFTTDILRGGMPTPEGLTSIPLLDDPATRPILENVLGLPRPKIDASLWHTYLRHFFARGWLASAPKTTGVNGSAAVVNGNGIRGNGSGGKLSGRVAVVTGASSGIGAAVAVALAREGASVAIAARRADALKGVQKQIQATGTHAKTLAVPTDVTNAEQVAQLVKTASTELGGPVDILVSCAGVMYFTMMANVQTQQWDQTVDVNCKGLLHCLASTVPGMLANGSGHIVAISSDAGRKVFPGLGVYSASKFFVEATLQALRLETAGKGLRVTSIQPGNVSTDLLGMSTDAEALKQYGEPSGAKVLDAEDVANAIVYAVTQPAHVAVNEVLVEPRDEPI